MSDKSLVLRDRQAWFAEMLNELQGAVSETEWSALTQADPRIIHRSFQGLNDFISLLRTESEVLHRVFEDMVQLLRTLRAQRDEALSERDEAANTLQDAYLRGLLTREEDRLGEWTAFGVTQEFSLKWLCELLVNTGETEAAEKVAWVSRELDGIVELSRLHRERPHADINSDIDIDSGNGNSNSSDAII
jgi:hypothetical protein